MLSKFFKKRTDDKDVPKSSLEACEPEQDGLNKKATQIALDLIQHRGGRNYLQGMKQVFKAAPSLVKDVAPEYRAALQRILEQD